LKDIFAEKMTTPKYRLAYFDVRALGEPIRWIFHYKGIPFVDERIEWNYPTWFAETKKSKEIFTIKFLVF
jgi:hypothetical protein